MSGAMVEHEVSRAVLVVDDNDSLRMMLVAFLERIGWRVLAAGNGRDGVSLFNDNLAAVSCALIDYSLPGMPSRTVVASIREARPMLPVVVMSGYDEADVWREMSRFGVQVLVKPFRLADLQALLPRDE